MIHTNRPVWLKEPLNKIDLVFFDLETTGGNPRNSSIIEIGAIKISEGLEVGRFETLVKPRHSISPIVQKITGINNEMIKNAPYIEDIFEEFLLFVGDAVLVSHGASADVAFFVHYKEKLFQKQFTNHFLCTHLLTTHFLPNIPSKTLTSSAEHFGIQAKNAHSALDDAVTTERLFWHLYEMSVEHGVHSCEDLIKLQGDQESMQKLGLGFDPGLFETAPSTSGILFILGGEHEISYLSATHNLRKAVSKILEFSQENKEFQKILVDATGFKIERTSSFLDGLIREKQELKRLSLPIDPRLVQKRSENFLQILIPKDLVEYARKNPKKVPFVIPEHHAVVFDDREHRVFSEETVEIQHETLAHNHVSSHIKHTRKRLGFIKTQKYKMNRKSAKTHDVHYGYLQEGVGYVFGQFSNADEILPFVEGLRKKFPFEDSKLSPSVRCQHLHALVTAIQTKNASLKSGLCVISNNAFKEFEIFVVANSRVVQNTNLRFEDAEKLKSPRYFTRLFEASYAEIKNVTNPTVFTDDVCSDIELFSFWLTDKHGEGEWIDFSSLESLYDARILE